MWKLILRAWCELLVRLGDVDLVGIGDLGEGAPLEVVIRSRKPRPVCEGCGGSVWSKGYRSVVLVDFRWRKRRWTCPNPGCGLGSFVEQDPTVGPVAARTPSGSVSTNTTYTWGFSTTRVYVGVCCGPDTGHMKITPDASEHSPFRKLAGLPRACRRWWPRRSRSSLKRLRWGDLPAAASVYAPPGLGSLGVPID